MRIAVEGCSHGCLDQIYSSILALDRKVGKKTALLLLCGDVQTLRNAGDMHSLAVPQKHKRMGDFHRYYSGERRAPILTLMIGGNHEASNYLWELYHGGWVAPNIYYLGAAGCVDVGGLTIAGISGIYKSHDYKLGRYEQMPYSPSTVRSIYHTRQYDTFRLHALSKTASSKPKVVLSHDWPNTIEQYGDVNWLKRKKPFFTEEIKTSSLGSPPLWKLLQDLQPTFWFSAHLHVRFAALCKFTGEATQVQGPNGSNAQPRGEAPARPEEASIDESVETKTENAEEMAIDLSDVDDNDDEIGVEAADPDQINIDEDELDEEPEQGHDHDATIVSQKRAEEVATARDAGSTRFLALSKCLEGQDFLQILDVPAPFDENVRFQRTVGHGSEDDAASTIHPSLQFNTTWLAVTKASHEYLSLERRQRELPAVDVFAAQVHKEEAWIRERLRGMASNAKDGGGNDIDRTQHFVKTAPATNEINGNQSGHPPWYTNPQTVALCALLEIDNRINPPPSTSVHPGHVRLPNGPVLQAPPPVFFSEAEEIRKIELAAQNAMKRKKLQEDGAAQGEEVELVTLLDDDEGAARWKEGAG